MLNKQLELLVALQDLDIMIKEIEEVGQIGFEVEGREKLEEARSQNGSIKESIEEPSQVDELVA